MPTAPVSIDLVVGIGAFSGTAWPEGEKALPPPMLTGLCPSVCADGGGGGGGGNGSVETSGTC